METSHQDYTKITTVAMRYGFIQTERAGFYARKGVEVDLSATSPDFVSDVIIDQLTKRLKKNGSV